MRPFQDSTTISLARKLAAFFPGSGNKTKKKTATLKIQLVYDALAEYFVFFNISSFRDNDQKASPLILKVAKAGDLVVRDLGYFVLDVFCKLEQKGIFYLSRFKHGVCIFSQDNDSPIDLVKLIKKHRKTSGKLTDALDIDVKIGAKAKLPTRIIIIPLPNEVVNQRRRKAKKNRDKRLNPDKAHLFLLGFNIFITNVDRQTLTSKQIAEAYQLRWRIEIIFKSWKSHFHITNVPTSNASCVKAYIYAMLIYICLVHVCIFIPLYLALYESRKKHLSLIKLALLLDLIKTSPLLKFMGADNSENLTRQILYHGAYETRKNRISYPQMVAR